MTRHFNPAGPCKGHKHYVLPLEARGLFDRGRTPVRIGHPIDHGIIPRALAALGESANPTETVGRVTSATTPRRKVDRSRSRDPATGLQVQVALRHHRARPPRERLWTPQNAVLKCKVLMRPEHAVILDWSKEGIMSELQFEWDEAKNKDNQRRHGISFEEAQPVFYDRCARLTADPDHSEAEDRFVLMGLDMELRLLVVCHCYRAETRLIRIISARKATRQEARHYRR